jgi:hypothetical protein
MEAISSVVVAFAGVMQLGASLVAVHFISKTLDEQKAVLDAMPMDEEVALLDRKAQVKDKTRREVIDWQTGMLPPFVKRALVVAVLCISVACYFFYA